MKKLIDELFNEAPPTDKGYLKQIGEYIQNTQIPYELKDIHVIPLVDICPRNVNKYINTLESHREMKKSLLNIRQQQPIVVVKIDGYEASDDDEREYLKKMQEEYGCKYFISSGERRFRAMVGLAMNKDIVDREDILSFYDYCKRKNPYSEHTILNNDKDVLKDKWKWYINCIVYDTYGDDKEKQVYNDTNLTARAITKFEIIANSYDEMKEKGIDIEYNSDIQKYILENKGIDVDLMTIKSIMTILKNADAEFINLILEGCLSQRDARNIFAKYQKDDNKEQIRKEIKQKRFSVEKYLEKNKEKANVGIKKKGKFWKNEEVLSLLLKVKNKEITMSQAIELVKKNG